MAKKPNFWKAVLAVVLFAVVAQIVHTIGSMLEMSFYKMPNLLPVWSKIMMPTAGPPPMSFFGIAILFGLISAALLVWVYSMINSVFKQKKAASKGLMYGIMLILVSVIPGSLAMILMINLPVALVLAWAVENAIIYLLGGMIIAGLVK